MNDKTKLVQENTSPAAVDTNNPLTDIWKGIRQEEFQEIVQLAKAYKAFDPKNAGKTYPDPDDLEYLRRRFNDGELRKFTKEERKSIRMVDHLFQQIQLKNPESLVDIISRAKEVRQIEELALQNGENLDEAIEKEFGLKEGFLDTVVTRF